MIKIGELASLTGVSIQTIRYYESEGLISPIEVDRWTNYRYYDDSSIERLSKITHLKSLGFSLKKIRNLSEETIKAKMSQIKIDIQKLTKNIGKLSAIRKEGGNFIMKNFINDEKVIGKWKKLAIVKTKEDFKLNKFDDNTIFNFNEIYFLPEGQNYWVFSWTKGTLYLNNMALPYEIIEDKLYIGIIDRQTNKIDNYAVYEQEDKKSYTLKEIRIKDDTNIPFIADKKVVGFWEVVDFVDQHSQFDPNKKYWEGSLFLKKYTFEPDGTLLVEFNECNNINRINWSKNVVINKFDSTVSEYVIKTINNIDYMIVEWKSGDYIFGGLVNGYYVLRKCL